MINLHPGEKIILERRKHWFFVLIQAIFIFCVAILPLLVIIFAELFSVINNIIIEYEAPILFFVVSYWLCLWMGFFVGWTNYYLDVLVVTDKRLIDIEQVGLFSRDVAEVRLENIEDIKVRVSGIIPSLLKFGDVEIQTAGEFREFIKRNIPEPYIVRDAISKAHDEILKNSVKN